MRWAAHCLCCGISTRVRWIASELNPSDFDSRRWDRNTASSGSHGKATAGSRTFDPLPSGVSGAGRRAQPQTDSEFERLCSAIGRPFPKEDQHWTGKRSWKQRCLAACSPASVHDVGGSEPQLSGVIFRPPPGLDVSRPPGVWALVRKRAICLWSSLCLDSPPVCGPERSGEASQEGFAQAPQPDWGAPCYF